MNEFFKKIKSWFSKKFTKDFSYEKEGVRPTRDWNFMIILFFIVLCVTTITSFYIYNQISSDKWFNTQTDANTPNVSIKQDLLVKTIERLDTNKKDFETVKSGGLRVADPSI